MVCALVPLANVSGGLPPSYRVFPHLNLSALSRADITKAARLLGYVPSHQIDQGLDEAMDWYVKALG